MSIFAVVAVSPRVWYNFEPPLSLKVCEDPRKSEDLPPTLLNGDCDTCEDARYKVTYNILYLTLYLVVILSALIQLIGVGTVRDHF